MTRKITSFMLAVLMLLSVCIIGTGSVSAESAELPPVAEDCNRYFFLMPEEWYNEYTDTTGIYWWEGTDACTSWPGYKAHKADADNVYYYDVPKDVEVIIWNNYVDGGADKTQDIYNAQQQTVNIGTVCYDPEENEYYPDGVPSFDGMIFVIDPDKTSTSVMAGKITWEGDWFYYYGNGEYGTENSDVNFEDLPPVKEGCNRYFFLLPEELKNEYTSTAGIYWWEGTDACTSWPGYEAHKADADNVYYYDVPKDVEIIIWNNNLDGGSDNTQDIYYHAIQTVNIGTVCYDKGENEYYPDGVPSFDGMIFVIDPDKTSTSVWAGKLYLEGDWFYYYANGEYGTEEPLVDFEDLPEVEIGCYRYFFLMPDEWYNEHTDTAGIYWWDGSATPDEWPGYKAHKADAENVYYYDVPRSVSMIIWNNFIDGGENRNNPLYDFAKQTRGINSEYYEPGENENFPEGTGNFNGMICVIDTDWYDPNIFVANQKPSCSWYYYFGNGEYGTDVDKDARALKNMYPDNNYDYMTDIVPYFYPDRFEGKAGLPWHMYDTLYVHNESEDTAPDYVVFEACVGGADTAFITKQFGDYYVTHHEIHSLYELSHFVFVPSEQKVYTLRDAWDNEDIDVLPAFESGKVGRHRGDANLDNSFNIKDATYIQKFLAHFDGFENTGFMNYDGDNDITIKDATAIQKALAGIKE